VEIDVDDQTVRSALKRHWETSDANHFSVEHKIYREGAVLQQIIGSGDLWVTEFILTCDGAPSYTVSILEFLEGQVAHEIQYLANPFDPEPSLMIPGIIISLIFSEQRKLVFRNPPAELACQCGGGAQ
jgi:hypothetical protein